MVDGPKQTTQPSSGLQDRSGVHNLAAQALSVLSAQGGAISQDYSSPQLQTICDAFVAADEAVRHDTIAALQTHGLTNNDIIEHIIPSTAHLLGERWMDNKLSFADVTIGAARLQETIRALNAKLVREDVLDGDCILLVVPRCEFHTLGIFVAAHQFRSMGIDVQLAIGMLPGQIAQLVKKHRFPAVGITASSKRSVNAAQELVSVVRNALPKITPTIIGGTACNLPINIKQLTGADFVTSDPERVISLCGLKTSSTLESVHA